MKFAATIEYISDKDKIGELRPAHRQYLSGLLEAGKLFCAGPFLDDFGALIIYEAETAEEAETLIANDPFRAGGVFVRWTVRPWKTVMGNASMMPS